MSDFRALCFRRSIYSVDVLGCLSTDMQCFNAKFCIKRTNKAWSSFALAYENKAILLVCLTHQPIHVFGIKTKKHPIGRLDVAFQAPLYLIIGHTPTLFP